MIFKQQLANISTVLNNTGNATKLLTSFNALDVAQQKVLLSSSLLSEKQKEQCITMATLSAANTKYTAEQLAKTTGVSAETLANWGLVESTDALTISQLAEMASSDAQAKTVLDKIIAQNAQAVANGEMTASNIVLTTSETSASLATGAFTTAIKANISAMWTWMTTTPLGWLTLLVAGVFAVVKAYDALTISVEEQKEKVEESLSAYEDAKSELSGITSELESQEQAMDDLLAKDKLTYAEKGQLEELQAITEELRIQKDLAEKEENRTEKQLAKDATELFNKQFGDYDISENAIIEYQNEADLTGNNAILIFDENNISAMIAGYRQFNKLLDEAYGKENQDDIDHFKSLTEDLEDSIFSTAQELQAQQENISSYYEKIKDTPYDDLTTEQKEIVDSYNAISNAITLIYQQLDPNTWNSMQVDNVFSTDGIEKTKEELVEIARSGELTPKTIKGYENLNRALGKTTLSAEELCEEIYAIAEAQDDVQGSNPNETALSYESLTKTAESATESVDTLRSAISSVNDAFAEQEENGSVSVDTMLAMAEAGYATALQFDSVTGACTINKEAMLDLVQAKIQNQIADLQLLQSNIQQKLADDGNTARESANGFYDLAKAKLAAASAEQLASMKQFNDAEAQINALQNASKNIKKIDAGSYSTKAKSSSSSKSSSDPLKDAFTQEYNTLKHNLDMEYITEKQYYDSLDALNQKYFAGKSEYLDEYRQYEEEVYKGLKSCYKDYIESQMNLLESQLDAGVINYKHYSSTVKSLLDNMFSDAKISAVDYHKYIQEMLNKQLDIYDKVLSAVANRFDKEIDKINDAIDGIEKQNDALEEQKSLMESAADAVVSYYDSLTDAEQQSIDNLEAKNDSIQEQINKYDSLISVADKVYDGEQKSLEEQQNLLQEKIDALNDENDALDLQYRKEQALIALRRAQTQRTKKVKYMPAITVM